MRLEGLSIKGLWQGAATGMSRGSKPVLILLHRRDMRFESSGYLLHRLAQFWQDHGTGVRILRGRRWGVRAEAVIPHLDLTERPAAYQAYLQRFPCVLNRSLTSIAKSTFSGQLVRAGDRYDGPVIIKTELNYAGVPEKLLAQPRPFRWLDPTTLVDQFQRRRPGYRAPVIESNPSRYHNYAIYTNLRAVPPELFQNPAWVVEKFLPEYRDGYYYLRFTYVLGPRHITLEIQSAQAIAKGATALQCREVETPAEILARAQALGVDFGKLDHAWHEGRLVLYDINPTPSSRNFFDHFGVFDRVVEQLAPGVDAFRSSRSSDKFS